MYIISFHSTLTAVGKLGPGDLLDVLTELFDIHTDWEKKKGLALKLTPGTLRAIDPKHRDPKDCLRDMLTDWLNTSDAIWSSLVQALRHPIVGHGSLAVELERKYLTQEVSSLQALVVGGESLTNLVPNCFAESLGTKL